MFKHLKDRDEDITAAKETNEIYAKSNELKKAFESFLIFNEGDDIFTSIEICQIMDFVALMKDDFDKDQFHGVRIDTPDQ